MMAVVQRVSSARVSVNGEAVGVIRQGLLVLLGVKKGDSARDAAYLAAKVLHLRIFADSEGKMNRSAMDCGGELLIVSQFTLYGDTSKGNRPSFFQAAGAIEAKPLYEKFVAHCRDSGLTVATGVFQAQMVVELTNDGPVTLVCRSESTQEVMK